MEECVEEREERTPLHMVVRVFALCCGLYALFLWGSLIWLFLCEIGLFGVQL